MSPLDALILSIVEGVTEFLPVSSTGHLILASHLLRVPESSFSKSFLVAIQLGAILAIVFLYGRTLLVNKKILLRVGTAFVPTAIIGFLAYPIIKTHLLGNVAVTLWALFWGGIALIIFEWLFQKKDSAMGHIENLSFVRVFAIGMGQALSVVPGVSRAAATILTGRAAGLDRKTAVAFSFLLAIPTMAAATFLDLAETAASFSGAEWFMLVVGFIGSFVTALTAVRLFVRYIERHTFTAFGLYRILLALAFWMLMVR